MFTLGSSPGRSWASRPTNSATAMPASHSVSSSVAVSPWSAACNVTANHRARVQIDRVLGLVRQVRAPVLHLRDPRILVLRALPLLVRGALLALAVQPRQVFAGRRREAGSLRQSAQKLLVTLPRLAPHDRTHGRVGFQGRRIDGNPLTFEQPAISQYAQHPAEDFPMRVQIDQPPGARNRRVIRRVLVQTNAHKTPQCQRIRQPPGNAALRPYALEIPDQQRTEIDPRPQRRTPVPGRIELRAPALHKLIEALRLQQLVQLLVKRMPRRSGQLRVRDPQFLLLLPLLLRSHRHAPILQTIPLHSSTTFCLRIRTSTTGC